MQAPEFQHSIDAQHSQIQPCGLARILNYQVQAVPERVPSWESQARATIYGNAIGDAIGLLSEFMDKTSAQTYYGPLGALELSHKVEDSHRSRWQTGDWTDDTDQMILIMQMLNDNDGQVDAVDYAARLLRWARRGFPELGDVVGMGIGATTMNVLRHEKYKTHPHKAAHDVWVFTNREAAPNGGVMRTSVLGVHHFWSLEKVLDNTLQICKVTHADHRCQASCVAVTSAIAMLLQRSVRAEKHLIEDGTRTVDNIIKDAYDLAKKCLPKKSMRKELKAHIFETDLSKLKLDEKGKIGYTYKCMGAGFWALKQNDFREALTRIVLEGGDADTNGAVAGALLGCKLGMASLPESWLNGLCHKAWLHDILNKFIDQQKSSLPQDPNLSF